MAEKKDKAPAAEERGEAVEKAGAKAPHRKAAPALPRPKGQGRKAPVEKPQAPATLARW
jgi:hypothetical protein